MAEKKVKTITKVAKKTETKKVSDEKRVVKSAIKTKVTKPSLKKEATIAISNAAEGSEVKTVKLENKATGSLKIDVLDINGKVTKSVQLPKEIFGAKINNVLMAQAVRVYLANQRSGSAHTKSRGEVELTKAKWYRQKGTGRARHGAQSAPIFVGGGVAHGPKAKDYSLKLSKNMRRAALLSSLSAKLVSNEISVIAGLETLDNKTKSMVKALTFAGYNKKSKTMLVLPEHVEKLYKAARNLEGITIRPTSQLTTYEILRATRIIFMIDAIEKIEKSGKESK